MALTRSKGIEGETVACEYLKDKGYVIVKRNYKRPYGEVDIIARNTTTLVFVEVKNRYGNKFGDPIESVTPRKITQIVRVAENFTNHFRTANFEVRFDIIEVNFGEVVNHIENAFSANDGNIRKYHW